MDEITMYERPAPQPESPTNGLDEFIDWDEIEERLAAGRYDSKRSLRAHVTSMFEAAGVKFARHYYREAIKGLFPEYRELYDALPANPSTRKAAA